MTNQSTQECSHLVAHSVKLDFVVRTGSLQFMARVYCLFLYRNTLVSVCHKIVNVDQAKQIRICGCPHVGTYKKYLTPVVHVDKVCMHRMLAKQNKHVDIFMCGVCS